MKKKTTPKLLLFLSIVFVIKISIYYSISLVGFNKITDHYTNMRDPRGYDEESIVLSFMPNSQVDLGPKEDGYYYSLIEITSGDLEDDYVIIKMEGENPSVVCYEAPEGTSRNEYSISKDICRENFAEEVTDDMLDENRVVAEVNREKNFYVIDLEKDVLKDSFIMNSEYTDGMFALLGDYIKVLGFYLMCMAGMVICPFLYLADAIFFIVALIIWIVRRSEKNS